MWKSEFRRPHPTWVPVASEHQRVANGLMLFGNLTYCQFKYGLSVTRRPTLRVSPRSFWLYCGATCCVTSAALHVKRAQVPKVEPPSSVKAL